LATISFTDAPATWAEDGYPYAVAFFQDRLCYGGNAANPDTIWMSKIGAYTTYTVGDGDDDDPITLTLNSREINKIQWMMGGTHLMVGTAGAEWWVSGPSNHEAITPTNNRAGEDSRYGSSNVKPVKVGGTIFYQQRLSSALREQSYNFSDDKYISVNASIVSDHLLENHNVLEMAYQQVPYSIIWQIRSDGTLLGFTYMREHEVFGWHRHVTEGYFRSVACIPGANEDEVWFVVERTIDGSSVKYIERLKPFIYDTIYDAWYVDCGKEKRGGMLATTAFGGLTHLEGETLDVTVEGLKHDDETVSEGAITLDSATYLAVAGLNYVADIETLDPVIEDDNGVAVGVYKRVTSVALRLLDTIEGDYGPDADNLTAIPESDGTTEYSGWTSDLSFDEGDDNESTVFLRQDEPLPFTILAINHEFEED